MISQQLAQPKSTVRWCEVDLHRIHQEMTAPQPAADTWVRLLEPANSYCDGDALLLCPISNEEWLAWLPSQGETLISTTQFCIPYI